MSIIKMTDLDLRDQRVLMREDLNVPLQDGKITSDKRIRAALPSIAFAQKAGARVLVMSHLGRPEEGQVDAAHSLALVAERLSTLLKQPVRLETQSFDDIDVAPGEVVLCENVRFLAGEKKNDEALAKRMASACDVFVMDAFATAHRAQASTVGVAQFAPTACAGPLLIAELEALGRCLENPSRPLLAIVGGAKVSTKLGILESLLERVDQLIVGGGIANTFIAASGFSVGKSLYEPTLVSKAKQLIEKAKQRGADIPIPVDVVVAKQFSSDAEAQIKSVEQIADDEMILDVGPKTSQQLALLLEKANTIVWNGPLGVFEFDQFAEGTKALSLAIAQSQAFSIAGGGDTLAAVDKYDIADKLSYISTGGGAFLEVLQGKTLPAVAILEARAA